VAKRIRPREGLRAVSGFYKMNFCKIKRKTSPPCQNNGRLIKRAYKRFVDVLAPDFWCRSSRWNSTRVEFPMLATVAQMEFGFSDFRKFSAKLAKR
jgi:hypothetical protein